MRARLRAAIVLVALALLAGCTSVPLSGPVERVSAAPGRVNPGVEIAPGMPRPDASPTEIIEGFLHAMAAWQPGYHVARAYLTPKASAAWDPDDGVRVYAEGTPVTVTEQGARLTAPLVGELDVNGSYTQGTGRLDHDFGLVKDDAGQWRIATPPPGLMVSQYLFDNSFVRVPVYFFAPGRRWLVPDARYFPRGQHAIERAARAVAAGPTPWLAPAVVGVPPAVRVVSVSIGATGLVDVVLEKTGDPLTADERLAVATQLAWTFRAFDTVSGVQISHAGQAPWQIAGYDNGVPSMAFSDADPVARQGSRQLFAVTGGRLVRVIEGAVSVETVPVAPSAKDVVAAAVRPDAATAVVVGAARTEAWAVSLSEAAPAEVALTASGLQQPALTRTGELWVAAGREVLWYVTKGEAKEVLVGDLLAGTITSARFSPDAARVALVVRRADGSSALGVARVVRTAAGVALEGWRELSVRGLSNDVVNAIDVGWRSADTLMALVGDSRGTTVIALHPDGSGAAVVGPSSMTSLVQLAVAPGVPPMVRDAEGAVYRYLADYRWSTYLTQATSILYPG